MLEKTIYHNLAERTGGALMLGVVGPVRTGKSTFIKRFMETLILPRMENEYARERARDELPQSGSGRMIMTAEPKFVPEEAVTVSLDGESEVSLRLVDCVGYMIDGASGQYEDGMERMVTTPWFDREVSMSEAAEKGTYKVISEHSTIGIVVTTDGSVCDLPREAYLEAEERVIRELKEIGKPFVVLLNSAEPASEAAAVAAEEIRERYDVSCLRVNCLSMSEEDITRILTLALKEFPLCAVEIRLPEWLEALSQDEPLKKELFASLRETLSPARTLKELEEKLPALCEHELIERTEKTGMDLGCGCASIRIELPRRLYYALISEKTGVQVRDDAELMAILSEMSSIRLDYDRLKGALESVRSTGYGVVTPLASEMVLEEPQIVRQGGKYTVRMKASAPSIHMMMTQTETEVTPALGGEGASEDILSFLLQGFDGDVNRIWDSNIFGKSLNLIAEEGLSAKIEAMPDTVKNKLRLTAQRAVNEGYSSLFCILI